MLITLSKMELTERLKKRQRRKRLKILFFFVIIFFVIFSIYKISSLGKTTEILNPLSESVEILNKTMKNPLQKIAEKELFDQSIEYGIVVKNLKTGESYYKNEDQKFQTASLYKLWAMGATFEKISKGELSEKEVLKETIEDLNKKFDIASEEAELTEGEVEKTVKEAMEKMIIISDNYSALLLASRIGNLSLSTFLNKYDFTNSSIGSPPKSTAKDISGFFEKLYLGKLVSKKDSLQMIEILKRQTLNDRIPKYLPENISVAHKTGELDTVKHDAGIVFAKNGDYIIVVLSSSNNPIQTAERIARFSEAVYKYFESRKLD